MKRTTDQKVGGSNPSGRAIGSGLQGRASFTLPYAVVYSLGMVSSSARTVNEYLSSLSPERCTNNDETDGEAKRFPVWVKQAQDSRQETVNRRCVVNSRAFALFGLAIAAKWSVGRN